MHDISIIPIGYSAIRRAQGENEKPELLAGAERRLILRSLSYGNLLARFNIG